MFDQICAHIHNWFCEESDIVSGEWTIQDGAIDLDGVVLTGQYFRIVGSALNDGVYQYGNESDEPLLDETFTGQIWPMKPPRAFLQIVADIEAWQAQYGAAMASPYQSENVIGVYSYTKASGSGNRSQSSADGWKSVFKSSLNPWRKLR